MLQTLWRRPAQADAPPRPEAQDEIAAGSTAPVRKLPPVYTRADIVEWGGSRGYHAVFAVYTTAEGRVAHRLYAYSDVLQATAGRGEHRAWQAAEEEAERLAEARARRLQARQEAEVRAAQRAEEKARREAEERLRRETEEHARADAQAQAQREAEEQARREAEERAAREAEARAGQEAEAKARR